MHRCRRSDDGARLSVEGLAGLQLSEFFLLLSSVGVAYRRCKLVWLNGALLGVAFISHGRGKPTDKGREEQLV